MQYSRNMISGASRNASRLSLSVASMLAVLLLSACSETHLAPPPPPLELPRPPEKATIPLPAAIQVFPVHWTVITPSNMPTGDFVFFALTPEDYENLARTTADTTRWVEEAMWRLNYYIAPAGTPLPPAPIREPQPQPGSTPLAEQEPLP